MVGNMLLKYDSKFFQYRTTLVHLGKGHYSNSFVYKPLCGSMQIDRPLTSIGVLTPM